MPNEAHNEMVFRAHQIFECTIFFSRFIDIQCLRQTDVFLIRFRFYSMRWARFEIHCDVSVHPATNIREYQLICIFLLARSIRPMLPRTFGTRVQMHSIFYWLEYTVVEWILFDTNMKSSVGQIGLIERAPKHFIVCCLFFRLFAVLLLGSSLLFLLLFIRCRLDNCVARLF